jgi:NADP-dependent 3-hydroxy acid dehydrogenase YdfG
MKPEGNSHGTRQEPEVVLLTGASTGLGLAIARLLVDTDLRLILCLLYTSDAADDM